MLLAADYIGEALFMSRVFPGNLSGPICDPPKIAIQVGCLSRLQIGDSLDFQRGIDSNSVPTGDCVRC